MIVRYLSHPEVQIDPDVEVSDWGLNDVGRARTERLAASGALAGTVRVVASAERKAVETAEILAGPLGCAVEVRPAMHENDRSATGFLPPPEFELTADRFFAAPSESIRGWERAVDAQARIVAEVEAVLTVATGAGDVLIVGHGGVGTLLYCRLAGLAIDRRHDQPAGGCYFAFDAADRRPAHGWRPLETLIEAAQS